MHVSILRLALPNILSNISVPLLSSVDTILMGHLSAAHLAAIGVASMVFTFLYGNFNALRMGTTGLSAQAFGKEDRRALSLTLFRALLLALLLGFLLVLLQKPLLESAIYLMHVDSSYEKMVRDYFSIRIYAAPAVLALYALMGWYFGVQNAYYPLWITLVVNLLNLFLSLYLVKVLGMGVEGVAYGTVVAQYGGLLLALGFLFRYRAWLVLETKETFFQKSALLAFLHINQNIFIRTTALTFVLAFFYAQAARGGELLLATMILLLQFMLWLSFAIDGFANAAESLVGRYYGAKEWRKFYRAISYSFYWGGGLALLFSLFYFLFGEWLLTLYTSDSALILATKPFMLWVSLMPLLSFWAFIWDGVFIGMTATKAMRDSVLLSSLLFLGLFYATKGIDFAYALWFSFLAFFLFRALFQWSLFHRKGLKLR